MVIGRISLTLRPSTRMPRSTISRRTSALLDLLEGRPDRALLGSPRRRAPPHLVEHAARPPRRALLLVGRQRGRQLRRGQARARARPAPGRWPAVGSNVQRGLPACGDQLLLHARELLALARGRRRSPPASSPRRPPWRPPPPSGRASSVPAIDQLELRGRLLGRGRIRDELPVDQPHAHRAHRARRTGCRTGRAPPRRRSWPGCRDRSPGSPEMTRQMTWTSLRKPSGNSGRIGRSIRREVRISFLTGAPSRLK